MEPISRPSSFDGQFKNESVSLRNPAYGEELREPAGFAREMDRRASLLSLAARFTTAVAAGVVVVVAMLYLFRAPASRQPDSASTAAEITASTKTDPPQSGQVDLASKPALAQFKALLAATPASQPAAQEQSEQLLQRFKQWREKDNSADGSP